MTLNEWIAQKGRNEMSRIFRVSGVSLMTLHRAKKGQPISRYPIAKKISQATGGAVSVIELCEGHQ